MATDPQREAIVVRYLAALDAALGALPASRREEIGEAVAQHIADARAELAAESESETESALRTLLDRLGTPEEIAADGLEEEAEEENEATIVAPPPLPRALLLDLAPLRRHGLLAAGGVAAAALVLVVLLLAVAAPAFTRTNQASSVVTTPRRAAALRGTRPVIAAPADVGLSEAAAVGALQAAGLQPVVRFEQSPTAGHPGVVTSEWPGAGTRLVVGSVVQVLVTLRGAPAAVPSPG
ncbi:MAG TPA: PASTA domain-containing protein [Acidimicrobiales bacterium]|nr:PASTA domain-containing protein [Acidimicrobiales bacterium]